MANAQRESYVRTDPLAAFLLTAASTTPAAANIAEMKSLTFAMVKEAAKRFQEIGLDRAKIEFNDTTSTVWLREPYHLHMFGMDADGVAWANNVFTDIVGIDVTTMADFEGVAFGELILENTPPDGSIYQIQLRFTSPGSGDIVPSIGSCTRPEGKDVICSWAEL